MGGWLSIALYFEFARAEADHGRETNAVEDERAIGYTRAVAVYRVNVGDGLRDEQGQDQSVLVRVVEFAESLEKPIDSLLRLYRVGDEIPCAGDGLLYAGISAYFDGALPHSFWGCPEGVFQRIPRLVHWKSGARVTTAENVADHIIERAPQAMYGVPKSLTHNDFI